MREESRKAFEAVHSAHDLRWNELTGYSSRDTRIAYAGWLACWNRRDADVSELQADVERLTKDIESGFIAGAYARLQYLQAAERDALQAKCDRLEACEVDAERYRWLRQRIEIRTHESISGIKAQALQIRVGCSFFDSKTVERNKPRDYTRLDVAIDGAIATSALTPTTEQSQPLPTEGSES